jgi:hypothetical protein
MCKEKAKLMDAYNRATEVYMDSVTVLSAKIGIAEKADFDRLMISSENFRRKSEDARVILEAHMDYHGC